MPPNLNKAKLYYTIFFYICHYIEHKKSAIFQADFETELPVLMGAPANYIPVFSLEHPQFAPCSA